MTLVTLILLGLVVVFATRLLLCRGIERFGELMMLSPKVQGQILGYSTSIPELVSTISTAAMGLLGAGLWNIAASNIINLFLFLSANLFYRQAHELVHRNFIDEVGFSVGAVLIPVLLVVGGGLDRSVWTAGGLLLFFVCYLLVDRWSNLREASSAPKPSSEAKGAMSEKHEGRARGMVSAVAMIVVGVVTIVIAGRFLGSSAEGVVNKLGFSQVAVGWILGFLTSLPELTSFFAIYATSKRKGKLDEVHDTQEALDNLAASNMCNLGIIYPLGILVFLMV